jgi:hypothetical protein
MHWAVGGGRPEESAMVDGRYRVRKSRLQGTLQGTPEQCPVRCAVLQQGGPYIIVCYSAVTLHNVL